MSSIKIECTSINDENPIFISEDDFRKVNDLMIRFLNKYGFETTITGFCIDTRLNEQSN